MRGETKSESPSLIPERRNNAVAAYDLQWESMRSGNPAAFEKIFKHYYPVLFNYGTRLHPEEDEVKDAIQSLFLSIWERRGFLGPTTSVHNYLLASLRRLLHRRSLAIRKLHSIKPADQDFHAELSIESHLIRDQTEREAFRQLNKAFEQLPARQKEAIYLRFYGGQDFAQIALIMDISVRAVYKLIYKGLEHLQQELHKYHIDPGFLLAFLILLA